MPYPPLQITFLGTGTSSGVPMVGCHCEVCTSSNAKDKRLRSSILVQSSTTTLVVDSGPDFRQQMLTHQVNKLDAILFTHSHKDHIAGLDDVRAYNYFQQKPMDVYATEATLNRVKVEFDYAFADVKYAGVPSIQLHHLNNNDAFQVGDMNIWPIPVWHMFMPVIGFRMGNFTYITDANRIEDSAKEKIKGSQILVLNALRKEKHISHFTLQEALDLADELDIPEVYLIHLSHQMGLHDTVSEELPSGRFLGYDGLKLQIP
ncbi:MBL fold metallo-hydrolase [Niabella sp. CJ426]|uniref:MBL fold metallo-hydrolase n=1 Tax=Niabella sp. CJ426 TaxID=3393740 RepID=UPI003D053C4B